MTKDRMGKWVIFIIFTPLLLILSFLSAFCAAANEFMDYPKRVIKGYFDESDNSGE
jgi:hypothetical protein